MPKDDHDGADEEDCFGEEATGPQWNIYWPVNNRMGAMRMRVNHEVPKFIF